MYDLGLAARLDDIMLGMLEMEVTRMFGGYGFLMNGYMCLGVWDDRLVIRIGTDGWDAICNQPHFGPMDFTGKVMKGWAMIHPDGLSEDEDLRRYVDMAIMFCAALPPKPGRCQRCPKTDYPKSKPHIWAMARTTSWLRTAKGSTAIAKIMITPQMSQTDISAG